MAGRSPRPRRRHGAASRSASSSSSSPARMDSVRAARKSSSRWADPSRFPGQRNRPIGLSSNRLQPMRVLVVEDDKDLNRQLADALVDAGYVVDRAYDGEEGHFLGDTEPYDAVVLDIGLPQMDGISVVERWRRDGRKMPVLMLTARDRWSDKVAGIDAGAD